MKTTIMVDDIEVELIRKNIKNVYLRVNPPYGTVRISATRAMDDEAIRLFIASKLPWIRDHQGKFHNHKRLPVRQFVLGETHYFLGNSYLLNVIFTNERRQDVGILSLYP